MIRPRVGASGDHGVVIYDILPQDCLNGVWTDTWREGHSRLFHEFLKNKSTGEGEGFKSKTAQYKLSHKWKESPHKER